MGRKCMECGGEHHNNTTQIKPIEVTKCTSCNGNHSASSVNCPIYQIKRAVLQKSTNHNNLEPNVKKNLSTTKETSTHQSSAGEQKHINLSNTRTTSTQSSLGEQEHIISLEIQNLMLQNPDTMSGLAKLTSLFKFVGLISRLSQEMASEDFVQLMHDINLLGEIELLTQNNE